MTLKVVDGITYDAEFVSGLRENCIQLRDAALERGIMDWAVTLSHVIVLINHVLEEIEDEVSA